MTRLDATALILLVGSVGGLAAASAWAGVRRLRPSPGGTTGRTALERAASYATLAVLLALAVWLGRAGIAVLVAGIAAVGLVEWARLTGLPAHHRVALQVANVAVVGGVSVTGTAAAEWLVAGLVLAGIAWPVIQADTSRALRDLGSAAVGLVVVSVLLVHGVLLAYDYGDFGVTLFAALAVACAGSDIGAFIVGRRFGRTPLAPVLSPNKTREGVVGNLLGAAVGLAPFLVLLMPGFPPTSVVAVVVLVAVGALWGDLLESAVKREAGVKDAASWLPGFGGILDRVDSLLLVFPLAYWAMRIYDVVR